MPAPAQGTCEVKGMKSRQAVAKGRLFRLECIALGMALAATGDREKVIQSLGESSLQSELVSDCLKAVQTRDPKDIAKLQTVFKGWGVDIGSSVTDSVIREIEIRNSNRRVREAMDRISCSVDSDMDQAIDELNLSLIDHASIKNKYKSDSSEKGDLF